MSNKRYITHLLSQLNKGLYEREEILAIAVLAIFSGSNIVFLGPPGTAKSLLSRRLAEIFTESEYFEFLMSKFSTPDEIFGPNSIKELKNDKLVRNLESTLATADFAFLDEVFKAGTGILNTLLTIINERLFRNGVDVIEVPLKVLLAASNETPKETVLDALYDRFTVRTYVGQMNKKENFIALLQSSSNSGYNLPQELKISFDNLEAWQSQISLVKLSPEVTDLTFILRSTLNDKCATDPKFYVSDRRWKHIANLMRASAFFCDRTETNLSDALIMRHCLWSEMEDRFMIQEMIENLVRGFGFSTETDLQDMDKQLTVLSTELTYEVFHDKDIYSTQELDGRDVFTVTFTTPDDEKIELAIDVNYIETVDDFIPELIHTNLETDLTCNFNSSRHCTIKGEVSSIFYGASHQIKQTIKPECRIAKDTRREKIDTQKVAQLVKSLHKIKSSYEKILHEIQCRKTEYEKNLDNPFIPQDIRSIPLEGISKQINEIQLKVKDCARLISIA